MNLLDMVFLMVYDRYLIPQYFRDVKVLWNGRFSLNVLQMPSKPIRRLEDIKGLVIGFAGGGVLLVVR
jgi:hypothetical protein